MRPLSPGDPRQIGRFEIIGLLGAGGMGEVYLGVADGHYAAVKLIRPQVVSPERFKREIGVLYRVPPDVAPDVLAHDSTAARPWFAAEYVPGITLDEAVQGHGPLPSGALWLLLHETAARLGQIHEDGIVHRDLKPANLMLVPDSVRLIDFGIALDGGRERLTRNGVSYGTPGFKAPEQHRNGDTVAAPADVYALGAMLAYAASGSDSGPDTGPLRRVDATLAAWAEHCLADDPQARPTAADLAAAARDHMLSGYLCWPPEIMSRIAKREDFARRPLPVAREDLTKVATVPPGPLPGPGTGPGSGPVPGHVPGQTHGGTGLGARRAMLAVGVTAGIATAVLTAVVYGVGTALASGILAGLRTAIVNGAVNGIGSGLTFGLMHGLIARFAAGRAAPGSPRPPDGSLSAAIALMIGAGAVAGAGYGMLFGLMPGLAAGLMVSAGTGTMTAWGRRKILS